jgi:hypothetical protein
MLDRLLLSSLVGLAMLAAIVTCKTYGAETNEGGDVDGGIDGGGGTDGEVTTGDGSSTADAGGPFCETVGRDAQVCDDFEQPGTFTGKWPDQMQYNGTFEIIDGAGIGGGRALRLTMTPTADSANVSLSYTSPTAVSYVDCEVAVNASSIPPTIDLGGPLWVVFDGDPPNGRQQLGLHFQGSGIVYANPTIYAADGVTATSGGVPKEIVTLTPGTWTRLRVVADVSKDPGALFVYIDGSLKYEAQLPAFKPGRVTVAIGAVFANTKDGGTAIYDLDNARVSSK